MPSTPKGPTGPARTPSSAGDVASTHAPFGLTVSVISAVAVLVVGQAFITIPLMPQLSQDWGVPQESAAWATTVFAVAYACGSLAGGPLSDRYGRRTILAGTVAAMAVATALVPLATGLPWASAARALQGLTAGSFVPMSYAYLSERVPERRLPLALTTVNAAGGASAVVSQIEGQVLGSTLGWRAVFLVSAPLLAVGALALRRILLSGTVGTPGRDAAGEGGLRVLRSARLWPLLVIAVPLLGSLTAIYTVVQLYGPADLVGDPGAMLGLRASALPAMVLAVLAAPVLGRFPALRRAAASLALAAAGLVLAALAGGGGSVALGAALFVFVLAISTAGPAVVQAIGVSAGAARTTAIAAYGFLLNLGSGAGAQLPLVVGSVAGVALILAALLAACTGLLALAHRAAVRHGRTAPVDTPAPARAAGRPTPPAADPQAAHAD
ncbi:Predicted arabinose efflux permease, MFS family [Streptomyces sp. LamerLS-316]|uniref:MFS transporter n=1 Tax=unclassified Streptomyces TaxID=2593676 RepID=UPI000823802B|nr:MULTISPECIES: MFS transporter [unclassified Streptomyces]MYQ37342.1 MFS transporter [Streptomyces sp. SID4921]SCK43999.1 Predicted arabinose efflux permease, MFS family [Streptomyces sp. LamerLS-316]